MWAHSNCAIKSGDGMFPPEDHMTLYSFVRFLKPKRILQIGCTGRLVALAFAHELYLLCISSFFCLLCRFCSTITAACALDENNEKIDEDAPKGKITCFDRSRSQDLKHSSVRFSKPEVKKLAIDEIDRVEFQMLHEGDIVFLESSHVTRPYGDTLYQFLYVLPVLPKGVYVHLHDVFLPLDYHRDWRARWSFHFTEQYLLALFLHKNSDWEIVWSGSHWPQMFAGQYSRWSLKSEERAGGSFWLRKKN